MNLKTASRLLLEGTSNVWGRCPLRKLSALEVAALCAALSLAGCSSVNSTSTAARPAEQSALSKAGSAIAGTPAAIAGVFKSKKTTPSWAKSEPQPDPNEPTTNMFAKKPEASPELRVATARVYEKNGNYAAASEQYEKALKKTPNDVATLLSYGHLLDHEGKLPEATDMYLRAVKASPKESAAYNDLGLCYARRGNITESLKALNKAVELQPERPLYRNNLATVLVQQRRTDEALAQLKAVNEESVAHYNLAYLLMQHQQESLAATHFRRASELNPSLVEARDWSERLAAQTAQPAPVAQVQRSTAPVAQMASLPQAAPRQGSYGPAPVPPTSPYLRPEAVSQANNAAVGSRYAGPAQGRPAAAPTPESLSNYQPQINDAELHFLPPVE
jgi:tetratricopeptide (TPR) repeat protein